MAQAEREHGISGYRRGCRCDKCTAGQRDYQRDYQRQEHAFVAKQLREHGIRKCVRTSDENRAHNFIQRGLKTGLLVRPSACEECGCEPGVGRDGRALICAHTPDKRTPEDHIWLCPSCLGEKRWLQRDGKDATTS